MHATLEKKTALCCAVNSDNSPLVKILVEEYGADITIPSKAFVYSKHSYAYVTPLEQAIDLEGTVCLACSPSILAVLRSRHSALGKGGARKDAIQRRLLANENVKKNDPVPQEVTRQPSGTVRKRRHSRSYLKKGESTSREKERLLPVTDSQSVRVIDRSFHSLVKC
eukprot:gb/GECG01013008.1/.p1 GENE.gb/GECG01013008.1/~~gb/GECG01013008.1/.p1  ORF type:complete len:167 (+),score=13.85 gb/GECG01013008.1/:1-501(+)